MSLVDISVPYGPGVNERGFIKDMARRFEENFKAAIPRPSMGLPLELRHTNISYLNYSKSSRNAFGWLELRLAGCLRMRSIIKTFQPDFIVMRVSALSLPQYFGAILTKIPFALKTAGAGRFESFYKVSIPRRIMAGSNEYIFRTLLNKSVLIDVVSDMQRISLITKYPQIKDKTCVVDNGVDFELFSSGNGVEKRNKLGIDYNHFVFGYVGGFPFSRGGKEVIDLIKYFKGSLPVMGLIVGDSGEAVKCKQYSLHLGVADLVTITGQVDYMEVPDLMNAIDIGLSILRPDKIHASEQKVRQYLAAGLSVIGTQGSNDFLRGYDFAQVVTGVDMQEIIKAASTLLAEGRSGLKRRATHAKNFIQKNHTIESKSNLRLKLWSEAIIGKTFK